MMKCRDCYVWTQKREQGATRLGNFNIDVASLDLPNERALALASVGDTLEADWRALIGLGDTECQNPCVFVSLHSTGVTQ